MSPPISLSVCEFSIVCLFFMCVSLHYCACCSHIKCLNKLLFFSLSLSLLPAASSDRDSVKVSHSFMFSLLRVRWFTQLLKKKKKKRKDLSGTCNTDKRKKNYFKKKCKLILLSEIFFFFYHQSLPLPAFFIHSQSCQWLKTNIWYAKNMRWMKWDWYMILWYLPS